MTIAVVGKYTGLKDAYKSLIEALSHGGMANRVRVKLDWIESEIFEKEDPAPFLEKVHGILVPGGFGERGSEGKILAAKFARERKVPYFGICFGMQMACIEAARSLAGIEHASSTEFGADGRARRRPDDRMAEGQHAGEAPRRPAISAARCGSAPTRRELAERFQDRRDLWRHADFRAPPPPLRGQYRLQGAAGGLRPGVRRHVARRRLPETVEYPDHPWFIGVQYHPELKSRPFDPHPLFASFI